MARRGVCRVMGPWQLAGLVPRSWQHSAEPPDLGPGPGTSLQMQRVLWTCLPQHLPTQSTRCPQGDRCPSRPAAERISPVTAAPCCQLTCEHCPFCHVSFQDVTSNSLSVRCFLSHLLPPHRTTFAAFSKPGHMLLCCGSSPNVTHRMVQDLYI